MPNKYPWKKGWNVPKQKYKLTNWSDYHEALRRRGDITIWLSEDALSKWVEHGRIYDGSGTPRLYVMYKKLKKMGGWLGRKTNNMDVEI